MTIDILNVNAPEWHAVGACRNYDPALFLSNGNNGSRENKMVKTVEAKRVCMEECKVRLKCLNWILDIEEHQGSFSPGVYGGTSTYDRSELHKLRKVSNG